MIASTATRIVRARIARHRIARAGALLALLLAACRGKDSAPPRGTDAARAADSSARHVVRPVPAITAWDDSLGGTLGMLSLERATPLLFVRDTTVTTPRAVTLLSHDAATTAGEVTIGSALRGCGRERNGTVATPTAAGVPVWSLALEPGIATAVGIDALDDLPPRDSSAAIIRIRRAIGTLPDDSIAQPFRGLPVVVRDAWRVRFSDAVTAWVAITTRTLGTESNPRLELVTVIAEPDPTSSDALRVSWWHREAGPEDRMVGADLLAAFRMRGDRPALAMSRSGDRDEDLEILDRSTDGHWRLRWSSHALGCGDR